MQNFIVLPCFALFFLCASAEEYGADSITDYGRVIEGDRNCQTIYETIFEDNCLSFDSKICDTTLERNCQVVRHLQNCVPKLIPITEKKCVKVRDMSCHLKEDRRETEMNEIRVVQKCTTETEEICGDVRFEIKYHESKSNPCLYVDVNKCFKKPIKIPSQRCVYSYNVQCKPDDVSQIALRAASRKCWMEPTNQSGGTSCHTEYEEDCQLHEMGRNRRGVEVEGGPIETCRKIPVNVCNGDFSQTNLREKCADVPEANTKYSCTKIPKNKCHQTVYTYFKQVCDKIPDKICKETATRTGTPVAKNGCHTETRKICKNFESKEPKTISHYRYRKECREINQNLCNDVTRYEMGQDCVDIPQEECTFTPREKCRRVPGKYCYKEPRKIAKKSCDTTLPM